MKTTQDVQSNGDAVKDTEHAVRQLSPYDLVGIRNRGSAASAVDLAGWLRCIFRK